MVDVRHLETRLIKFEYVLKNLFVFTLLLKMLFFSRWPVKYLSSKVLKILPSKDLLYHIFPIKVQGISKHCCESEL